MTRREFLAGTGAVAGGALAAGGQGVRLDRLGVGLFTIPTMLERDFAGTMKTLATIGYKEVETFGPYPFSAESAQQRWKTVSASLNFKGSGYFGLTARDVKAILDRNGLSSPSMHTDLDSLRAKLEPMAEAAHVLGQRYVVLPAIPEAERRNLDGYKRMAEEFNRIGSRAAALGLRFAYHNHGYGLVPMEGRVPFEVVAEGTDKAVVDLQMDLYWTTAGGADPVAYLRRFAGRYVSVHIKDMAKRVRFAGDGGDSAQWIELFPYIADAGAGVLDLAGILAEARRSGVRHFFLERDQTPTPDETLRASYQYLVGLRLI